MSLPEVRDAVVVRGLHGFRERSIDALPAGASSGTSVLRTELDARRAWLVLQVQRIDGSAVASAVGAVALDPLRVVRGCWTCDCA